MEKQYIGRPLPCSGTMAYKNNNMFISHHTCSLLCTSMCKSSFAFICLLVIIVIIKFDFFESWPDSR